MAQLFGARKAPANKKCIVGGCDECTAYPSTDQHAIPAMVVEAVTGCSFVMIAQMLD